MLQLEQLALRALMFRLALGLMATGWLIELLKMTGDANLTDLCPSGYA
jgi:hypothetical protein